jgi:hypothetical protein
VVRIPGTECIHLPETHCIVKLLRDIVDCVAPGVALITETNVPHEQNVSYFGDGSDEAHMVYNFALPPLVLHTFYAQNATAIAEWAAGLVVDSDTATFFNMLDTHDGIGVMGVKGVLSPEQIKSMIEEARRRGALISYKATEEGEEPYEINTTWWSAIDRGDENEEMTFRVQRYVASRSLALVIKGVPGIYTHGAMALPSDHALAERTGVRRDVNRGPIDPAMFSRELENPQSKRSILSGMLFRVDRARTHCRAFHPHGKQQILQLSPDVFTLVRVSPEGQQFVVTLTNVTDHTVTVEIELTTLEQTETAWRDLISGNDWEARDGKLSVELAPYDVIWLSPASSAPTFGD